VSLFLIILSKKLSASLPTYNLSTFRPVHRNEQAEAFGNNRANENHAIEGFEVYSTDGIKPFFGPVKTDFFILGLNLTGHTQLEINHLAYKTTPNSIFFKSPDKLLLFDKPSLGYYGYYLFFSESFIEKVVPNFNFLQHQFPFLSNGAPVFELNKEEVAEIKNLILKIENELQHNVPNREWMIGSYLFQLFITAHRSYSRQDLVITDTNRSNTSILERFKKLIETHHKTLHGVREYADMLHVTPSHLSRLIKQQSQKTASTIIQERLLIETKSLLKYSDKTISEIAYELNFSDVAHFSHFFKQMTGQTPKQFQKL
jgi:AraC family transcriptional regulator, transcriptional activator of pobA